MGPRLDARKAAPGVYRAMLALEAAVKSSGLEQNLLDLVRLRASQINGCAYCIDMPLVDVIVRTVLCQSRNSRGANSCRERRHVCHS